MICCRGWLPCAHFSVPSIDLVDVNFDLKFFTELTVRYCWGGKAWNYQYQNFSFNLFDFKDLLHFFTKWSAVSLWAFIYSLVLFNWLQTSTGNSIKLFLKLHKIFIQFQSISWHFLYVLSNFYRLWTLIIKNFIYSRKSEKTFETNFLFF